MSRIKLIFEKQWLNVVFLAVACVGLILACGIDGFQAGQLWGVDTIQWLWLAVALAVIHQIYVWFCWRTQLHLSLLTRLLGKHGFVIYAAVFFALIITRAAAVFILAYANRDSLPLSHTMMKILAVIALIPSIYLFYSVVRYFTFTRALGIDHFDPSYHSRPFVRKGIFRFTRNGMYTFGILLIWVPALWFASTAALFAALFNHLYVWIHYFATELPDIKRIYNPPANE